MRQNPNTRRSRGRGNRKPGNSRNQIFDSNGPGARVRGNSAQIYEKYQQLARDATSSGDRVAAENYFQHAEHYFRLMEAAGANRNGSAQDENQQRNGSAAPNAEGAETNQQPVVEVVQNLAEAVVEPDAEAVVEIAPVVVLGAEPANTEAQDQTPPEAANGGSDIEDDAKPVRRARGRRPNGSANGQSAPDKDTEAAASEKIPIRPTKIPIPLARNTPNR